MYVDMGLCLSHTHARARCPSRETKNHSWCAANENCRWRRCTFSPRFWELFCAWKNIIRLVIEYQISHIIRGACKSLLTSVRMKLPLAIIYTSPRMKKISHKTLVIIMLFFDEHNYIWGICFENVYIPGGPKKFEPLKTVIKRSKMNTVTSRFFNIKFRHWRTYPQKCKSTSTFDQFQWPF